MPGPSITQHNSTDNGASVSTTVACTFNSAIAQHDTLVVSFGCGAFIPTFQSLIDTSGNTWTLAPNTNQSNGTGGIASWMYYAADCKAAGAGANTVTFTIAGGGGANLTMAIAELTGVDVANPLDISNGANANTGGTSSVNLTTTQTSTIGLAYGPFNSSPTAGASWALVETNATTGAILEQQSLSSAGPQTATITQTSGPWVISAAYFCAPRGLIVGESDVVFATSGTLGGSGALSATSAVTTQAQLYIPQFAKLGDWDPTAYAITWFDGTEDSGGWWDRVDIPTAPAGAISAAATVVFTTSGTLAGAGALLGASNVVFAATSTPTITGSSSVIFAASGTLSGTGVLVGASGVVFATAATLTATGALVGSSAAVFAASTTPTIQGASAVVFAASATPAVQAATAVIFTTAGTLVATGALAGESDAVFSTSASIGLAARSAVVFASSGTLTGGHAPPVVVGGWASYGGSQPVPALPKTKRRRFKSAAEVERERDAERAERRRQAEELAAARIPERRADLAPRPRPVEVERPEVIVGTAVSTFAASIGQHAQGTSRHVGRATQLVRNVDTARAELAELENIRLRRALARVHVEQLNERATRARADTLAASMPDVDPMVIRAMANPPILRKLRRAS